MGDVGTIIDIFGIKMNMYGLAISLFFAILFFAFYKAQTSKRLNWLDMITRDGTKVSTTKILQLIGGFVGTWVIIKLTLTKELTTELFVTYLMYVASIDGYAKYILAKFGSEGSDDSSKPYATPKKTVLNETATSGSAKATDE